MKLLAIDTATEQCSATVSLDGRQWSNVLPTARGHADTILPMVDELFAQAGCRLRDLDGIAFGRGPGSFTGVRIAISVAQGLGFGAGLPLVGISNLAAVAQQAASTHSLGVGSRIAVCMDARMLEVYWATYRLGTDALVLLEGEEEVCKPATLTVAQGPWDVAVGSGWQVFPDLALQLVPHSAPMTMLPRAVEIALLAERAFANGQGLAAGEAEPVYLRDNVVTVRAL